MNMRSIITDSFHFYKENLLYLVYVCAPLISLTYFLQDLLPNTYPIKLFSPILATAAYSLYTAAAFLTISRRSNGEAVRFMPIVAESLSTWGPFFLLTLAFNITVSLGLILLIIPGVWIGARLSLFGPFLVVHKVSPLAAIRLSYRATAPFFRTILTTLISVAVPLWLFSLALNKLVSMISGSPALFFASDLFEKLLGLFLDVVIYRMFLLSMPKNDHE